MNNISAQRHMQLACTQLLQHFTILQPRTLQAGGVARKIVSHAGAEPTALLGALDAAIRKFPRVTGSNVQQARLELTRDLRTQPADFSTAGIDRNAMCICISGASFLVMHDSERERTALAWNISRRTICAQRQAQLLLCSRLGRRWRACCRRQ